MATPGKIFISYRRDDSATITGRMYDWLVQRVPKSDLFFDVDLEYGEDFVQRIQATIAQCKVMLVVIGPRWISADGSLSTYVKMEVEQALRQGVRIFPILVGGASMPADDKLPDTLRALSLRNAAAVRDGRDFPRDMEDLAKDMAVTLGPPLAARLTARRPVAGGGARSILLTALATVVVLAIGLGVLSQTPEDPSNPIWFAFHSSVATATPTPTATLAPIATLIPPTPTQTQSQKYQALYNDLTSNRPASVSYSLLANTGTNANWEQSAYSNKTCSFTPGPYHLQSFQHGGVAFFCSGDTHASFNNFLYIVRTGSKTGNGSGVFFRGSSTFLDFDRFDIYTDGGYSYLTSNSNGGGPSADINKGLGAYNTIGVLADGTNVALFINGRLQTVVTETARTTGIIGVAASAATQDTYVNFDAAQVWRL
jgi:hypothetical protein